MIMLIQLRNGSNSVISNVLVKHAYGQLQRRHIRIGKYSK
jgi:hypothetical protein